MGDTALEQIEASAPTASPTPALLEAVDRDGLVRQSWRIEHWPVSIGRALDNTIVISDPHVAAHHATIDVVPGGDMRVAEDDRVVERAPDRDRPAFDPPRLAHEAVAVDDLKQRRRRRHRLRVRCHRRR